MLANAERGDFGERILTWNMNLIKRRKDELLLLAVVSEEGILEEIEVDRVSVDYQVEGTEDGRFREIFEGGRIET